MRRIFLSWISGIRTLKPGKSPGLGAFLLAIGFLGAGLLTPDSMGQADPPAEHRTPKLDTDLERIRYLSFIKQRVPNLFEDAVKYEINLFELLERQSEINRVLMTSEEYRSGLAARESLISMRIEPQEAERAGISNVDESRLKEWIQPLHEELDRIPDGQSIAGYEAALLKRAGSRTSDALLGALLRFVPADKKAELSGFRTFEEKISFLRANLPSRSDGVLPDGFRAAEFGFSKIPGKDEVFETLVSKRSAESSLARITEIKAFLLKSDPEAVLLDSTGSKTRARNAVGNLTAEDLIWASNANHLEEVFGVEKPHKGGPAGANENIKKVTRRAAEFLEGGVEGDAPATGKIKGIELLEVPASVGIFRGCVGGDCASQKSFPYPNDPNERVFFVMDGAQHAKGYVSATLIEADGGKVLYVHTIAGARLSKNDVRTIFGGLNAGKDALKVKGIAIPNQSNIGRVINYEEIRKVYEDFAATGKSVPLKYKNPETRELIEDYRAGNSSTYDFMSRNRHGMLLDGASIGKVSGRLKTVVRAQDQAWKQPEAQADRADLVKFAVQLRQGNRKNELKRVLEALGSEEEFGKFFSVISNDRKLKVEELRSEVTKSLASLGVNDLSRKTVDEFAKNGLHQSPDLFSEAHRDATLALLKEELAGADLEHLRYLSSAQRSLGTALFDHLGEMEVSDRIRATAIRIGSESHHNRDWTASTWRSASGILRSGGLASEKMAMALGNQRSWPTELWREVPEFLKEGGVPAERMCSALSEQKVWPLDVWKEIPKVMRTNEGAARWIALALRNHKEWPPEVWAEVPRMLRAGGIGAARMAYALGIQEKWPPEVWAEVPGLLRKHAGASGEAGDMARALKRQATWPPEVWAEVPGILRRGGVESDAMISSLKKQENWPQEVWAEVPGVLKRSGSDAELLRVVLAGRAGRESTRMLTGKTGPLDSNRMNGLIDDLCK